MAQRGPTKSDVPAKVWRKIPIDPELSKPGEEVRVLPDGRVLWKNTGLRGVREWPSREAYVQWWKEAKEERSLGPADLLPPIDDFLRDVETHARALGPRLNIPDEALDGTVASLTAVDKALTRIPLGERPVPDLVTPIVAYVGEVVRRASGGQWSKPPPTYKMREAVYAPGEYEAWLTAKAALAPIAEAAGKRAEAEARARRASAKDVRLAIRTAQDDLYREINAKEPKPLRYDMVEHPTRDANAPYVTMSNGRNYDPFVDVSIRMIEPSKRPPLRDCVEATLFSNGYLPASKPVS
jgi:hypothetical protein